MRRDGGAKKGRPRGISKGGVIDSQSVEPTESGGIRGFDASKKVMGRKRYVIIDMLGLLVGLVIHAADIQDRDGAPAVMKSILQRWPWLCHVLADGGYVGPKLRGALRKVGKFTLEIIKRSDNIKVSRSCRTDGWWNEHSPGSASAGDRPRTSSETSRPPRRGFSSPISASSPEGS
ncbi:transposase [Neorhizobium petrolearium]